MVGMYLGRLYFDWYFEAIKCKSLFYPYLTVG